MSSPQAFDARLEASYLAALSLAAVGERMEFAALQAAAVFAGASLMQSRVYLARISGGEIST